MHLEIKQNSSAHDKAVCDRTWAQICSSLLPSIIKISDLQVLLKFYHSAWLLQYTHIIKYNSLG